MNLTFKGFLRGYCRELTGLQTDSLSKLLRSTLSESPAAAEAVMCFAAVQGKAGYLAKLAKGTTLEQPYREVAEKVEALGSMTAYLTSSEVPPRYDKVWRAYRAKKEAIKADRRVIALMREKTLEAMAQAGLTVYGICKELSLNAGNVYAYLNGGDVTKVSRDTARRIMEAVSPDPAVSSIR